MEMHSIYNHKAKSKTPKVKTFTFPIEKVTTGEADDAVNSFSIEHNTSVIQLDRIKTIFVYRIIYFD